MFDKMKQMMEMKKQADKLKKELEAVHIEIKEVPGIDVVINGAQFFQSISVEERHLTPENKKRFEMDLIRSLNAAIKKSQKQAAMKMQSMGGFPGLS